MTDKLYFDYPDDFNAGDVLHQGFYVFFDYWKNFNSAAGESKVFWDNMITLHCAEVAHDCAHTNIYSPLTINSGEEVKAIFYLMLQGAQLGAREKYNELKEA